ncbi:hypothetical protein TMES_07510 [Thalassospira mesophila]|uniref:Uncharacterized protein n=1 Tax=Thalassospira mesophila TaxID=1293891 RepID=A0A1Y2L4N7_9PROT|nr:hypothetical protein TMES_07510 [Thalassospira mesophila]
MQQAEKPAGRGSGTGKAGQGWGRWRALFAGTNVKVFTFHGCFNKGFRPQRHVFAMLVLL